ncbi:MAG: helix-turn-helix domain-containing protein [Oscillospiraceae bacterium]|nr:helix-turn-helix domain-containing protein [Oscillospiraceae bacterium]
MKYMGTYRASQKWGCSQATIRKWCNEGKIPGADHDKKGSPWRIPEDTEDFTEKYMGTYKASQIWGYSQATIRKWCNEGKIPGAEHDKKGSPWRIPENTQCPVKK